jgi:hypothetical protein
MAAFLSIGIAPDLARAALPLTIETQELMDGIREHSEVIVKGNGVLRVKPPVGGGLGFLHLRANRIVVEAGGTIDANGAGFQGKDGTNGDAPDGSQAGGKVAAGVNEPGSGGASVGGGGRGTTSGCSLFAIPGGTAYTMPALLQLGAGGGAAHVADNALASRGGHGGGRITLEAAIIEIHGIVRAEGTDGINPAKVGSGGGGGGAIQIITAALSGGGILSVAGGNGGQGTTSGGGGGGGVLLYQAPKPMPASIKVEIQGGASGACGMIGAGEVGMLIEQMGDACPDVDGDGLTPVLCGGTDCDDADADIRPPAEGELIRERCDRQDNDCNGAIDDDLPEGACAAGFACVQGACVESAGPADAGPDAAVGAAPDHIEYAGGCRIQAGAGAQSNGRFGLVLILIGAAALARRKLRTPRPARAPRIAR